MWVRTVITGAIAAGLAFAGDATACPATVAFNFPDPRLAGPVLEGPLHALIFTGRLRVNTDGAPNSYHPMGKQAPGPKPINFICNALAIVLPDGQRLSSKTDPKCSFISKYYVQARDSGWKITTRYRIDWYAIPTRPVENGRYRPCIQSGGKYAGFFVSQTALATGASQDICDVRYWADSLSLPYITLPSGAAGFASRGAAKGDLALVQARIGGVGRTVVAVVADYGNSAELGEGSVALHRLLRGQEIDPEWGGDAYALDIPSGVTTILFPDKSAEKPITAASLQDRKAELVTALGGDTVLQSCTGG